MTNQRFDSLNNWLKHLLNTQDYVVYSTSNDASFRQYFRVEHNNNTYIVMDAPPDKENSDNFVKIATLLKAHNLYVPDIINMDLQQGFLLLEDLGDSTFLQTLNEKNRIDLYKKAIDEIIKMQAIDCKTKKIAPYDKHLLKQEMQLLTDWYLPKIISNTSAKALNNVFQLLSNNACNSMQSFVHRDYHSRNLMIVKDKLAIIDFQDAVIGPYTYDLCSLLKDAYFELSNNETEILLKYYYKHSNIKIDFSQFETQFELMALQRHLKILGIFKRLSVRDGKHQYLENIPLVEKHVACIANKYTEFAVLKEWL